jgi:hypothetical protein
MTGTRCQFPARGKESLGNGCAALAIPHGAEDSDVLCLQKILNRLNWPIFGH